MEPHNTSDLTVAELQKLYEKLKILVGPIVNPSNTAEGLAGDLFSTAIASFALIQKC